MVVFGNGTHVDLCLRSGHGVTSDLRERDPELETIRAFERACTRIHSCINEGYSQGFLGVYWRNRFQNIWDRVRKFQKGANDGNVLTEGELLDLWWNGCQKKMLPNTQSIEGL